MIIYVLYFVYDKYFKIEQNNYLKITINEHKWIIYQKLTHKNTPKQKHKKTDIHTHKDTDKDPCTNIYTDIYLNTDTDTDTDTDMYNPSINIYTKTFKNSNIKTAKTQETI